ncbi:tail protein X [Pseudomonas aeruginosa]|uniref:tail protein X n=1 Tax=Pseudomonas aeruginosa TaxID=287 RepID=UPI003896E0DB
MPQFSRFTLLVYLTLSHEANHGLADHGPPRPPGLKVTMPDIPTAAPERQMVNLWD